ncbi:MAG TPA: Clp protease N-terminal domain-containing protein [Candidatus Dormibacteraeota bacterium]|nr:Clp protease N-terminal domain-containing protein [Candidatus Dormibacteraeota bacterium]
MTRNRDFKRLIRKFMRKTGESYATARLQLQRAGPPPSEATAGGEAMNPFQRFSEPAKQVLTAAQEEAERDGHGEIRPDHLMIGVLRQPASLGARALRSLGVDLVGLLDKLRQPPSGLVAARTLPTAATKRVIDAAVGEADRMDHRLVATEYLVLALTIEESAAHSMLAEQGVTVERLRQAAERLWAERQPEERADPAPERQLPPPSVIVGALLERARSLAAMEEAPVAEMEHLMRALTEPGSEIAPLLERFGVGLGNLRAALAWAPEVRAVAAELARSQTLKEDAIRSRDYEAPTLHRRTRST